MNGDIWEQVKDRICKKNNSRPAVLGLLDCMTPQKFKESSMGVLELEFLVQTDYHKKEIDKAVLPQIRKELSFFYKKPFGLNVKVDESRKRPDRVSSIAQFMQLPLDHVSQKPPSLFREEFTFDSFIVGPSNEFAHAACLRVASCPGDVKTNPLFVFGPTGLGKTHLLHAIGNYLEETTDKKISYLSAEGFLNECVSGIRNNKMHRFRQKYRQDSYVLLIDDIHVLGRGEHAQEEFFHTLNAFFDTKRQVVVTCDRLPRDISGLKDRIRTRLEGGLIVDIGVPDLETKIAIAKHKAKSMGLVLSEEAFYHVAKISINSIRELEGALNKLSYLHGNKNSQRLESRKTIELQDAKGALAIQTPCLRNTLSPEKLLDIISVSFGLSTKDIKSKSRRRCFVVARQVGMYLMRKHLNASLKEVGNVFGKRDHSTVLSSIKKASLAISTDADLKEIVKRAEKNILNALG